MNTCIPSVFSKALRLQRVEHVNDEQVRRVARRLTDITSLNYRLTLKTLCELVGRPTPEVIFASDFARQIQDACRKKGWRVPRARYSPTRAGCYLMKIDGDLAVIFNDRCDWRDRTFSTPQSLIAYVARKRKQSKKKR